MKTNLIIIVLFITFIGVLINGFLGVHIGTEKGIDCGIIISKMDILTDNGTGEYKRLSDLYFEKNCPIIDFNRVRDM